LIYKIYLKEKLHIIIFFLFHNIEESIMYFIHIDNVFPMLVIQVNFYLIMIESHTNT
jgi:hypothetical protein